MNILLVIDGLGVGAMTDVKETRPQDIGTNTLQSISTIYQGKNFTELGLYNLKSNAQKTFLTKKIQTDICALNYKGADSFLGHHYLIGNKIPHNKLFYIENYAQDIVRAFGRKYSVTQNSHFFALDNNIFIANNIEAEPGSVINVVANLKKIPFSKAIEVGEIIRKIINPLRTIVMGGKPCNHDIMSKNIRSRIDEKGNRICGIDIPQTGIYNAHYQVVHLGKIQNKKKSPHLLEHLEKDGRKVALIGKTADLFGNYGEIISQEIQTETTLKNIVQTIKKREHDFLFTNIQKIDLAGHAQNVIEAAKTLETIDNYLPTIVKAMKKSDRLIITADHGNDPLCGHSGHTREYVPFVSISNQNIPKNTKNLTDITNEIGKDFGWKLG